LETFLTTMHDTLNGAPDNRLDVMTERATALWKA